MGLKNISMLPGWQVQTRSIHRWCSVASGSLLSQLRFYLLVQYHLELFLILQILQSRDKIRIYLHLIQCHYWPIVVNSPIHDKKLIQWYGCITNSHHQFWSYKGLPWPVLHTAWYMHLLMSNTLEEGGDTYNVPIRL